MGQGQCTCIYNLPFILERNVTVYGYRINGYYALSQVRICRPPPLRSGHIDIKDAVCAEIKDVLNFLFILMLHADSYFSSYGHFCDGIEK